MGHTDEQLSVKFSDFVIASVAIKSSPKILYKYLTDIENLSQFFPQVEFKLDKTNPLSVGSIYYTRKIGTKKWSTYRIRKLEPNKLMSAELLGKDPVFEVLRYEHRFSIEGSGTVSYERIDYKFRFGIAGYIINLLIGRKIVKKQVLDAHFKLKQKAERL